MIWAKGIEECKKKKTHLKSMSKTQNNQAKRKRSSAQYVIKLGLLLAMR